MHRGDVDRLGTGGGGQRESRRLPVEREHACAPRARAAWIAKNPTGPAPTTATDVPAPIDASPAA